MPLKKTFQRVLLIAGGLLVLAVGYLLLLRRLDRQAVEAANFYPPPGAGRPMLLPSLFADGERFYVKLPAQTGDTLLCFGDTGGGISLVPSATLKRLGLTGREKVGLLKGLMPMRYILFSDLFKDAGLPAPVAMRHLLLRRPFSAEKAPLLLVPPDDAELRELTAALKLDVFLGQNFFMGKSWTIDYPKRQLWVHTPLSPSLLGSPGVQRLGFRKNAAGEKTFGHPSLRVEIDGEPIDLLFDTGATLLLSDSGKTALHTGAGSIGGSFIARSVFDGWRRKHPDWRWYPAADRTSDVIEVPELRLGGRVIGPALFAVRDDENWSQGMQQTMDKVVRGALGGSALKYVRVTIDYNSELIRFE